MQRCDTHGSTHAVLVLAVLVSSGVWGERAARGTSGARGTSLLGTNVSYAEAKRAVSESWGAPPDADDYNKETPLYWNEKSTFPFSLEAAIAVSFICTIASVPLILAAAATHPLTKYHYIESIALVAWLGGAVYLFTQVLLFTSSHFKTVRSLTIVESVYLLAQVITTVGYGDITPAYPRGQVCLALYVLFALLFYGGLMMELSQLLVERAEEATRYISDRAKMLHDKGVHHLTVAGGLDANAVQAASADDMTASASSRAGTNRSMPSDPGSLLSGYVYAIDYMPFVKSMSLFSAIAIIGIIFWHEYPGENKSWLQATYMSVITLSTVGFGSLTATTEIGKVFAAYWMIFGVTALGAVISAVVDLVVAFKISERRKTHEDKERYEELVQGQATTEGMDRYSFLKCELLHADVVSCEVFDAIEAKFQDLHPGGSGAMATISPRKLLASIESKSNSNTPRQATPRQA